MPNKRKREEYPSKSGIIVSPKTNPSGSKAYRVDIPATITGRQREQRQFRTKEEARNHARQRYAEITRFGHAAFNLTAHQREDAFRAIGYLGRADLSEAQITKKAARRIIFRARPVHCGRHR